MIVELTYDEMLEWHEESHIMGGEMRAKNLHDMAEVYYKVAADLSSVMDAMDEVVTIGLSATFNFPVIVENTIKDRLSKYPRYVSVSLTVNDMKAWAIASNLIGAMYDVNDKAVGLIAHSYYELATDMANAADNLSSIEYGIDCVKFQFPATMVNNIKKQLAGEEINAT